MSKKRPQAYEESKKVPNIRIAWNIDEDKILANLEIHHKPIQKARFLIDSILSGMNLLNSRMRTIALKKPFEEDVNKSNIKLFLLIYYLDLTM